MLILFAVNSSAQTFGIKGGLNLSTHMFENDGDKDYLDNSMKPSFHLGATMECQISNVFSFEAGILLSTKGNKVKNSTLLDYMGVEETYKSKSNLYYIDIPFNAKATIELNGFNIYGAVGPYMGIGIQGKANFELGDETEIITIKFGQDEYLRRLEFGLTFGGGVEINRFLFGLSYNLGLTNLHHSNDYTKLKNRVLSMSVGYKFGKHRTDKSDL